MATTNKNFRVKNGLEVGNAIGVGTNGTSFGTAGQILTSNGASLPAEWVDQTSIATSTVKHQVKLAETIAKGQAVYISTATGANMIASKASNAMESTSSKTMGLLETGGVLNDQVNVITEGMLDNIDVGSASAGDPVWLGTGGNLIYGLANKPIAPAHLVFIGIVTKTGTAGRIFIRVQNGFEINELHNVLIGTDYTSTPADNNILAYDSANSLWTNQTAEQAGVANLSGATFTGNVAGTNISLSGNVNATTVNATTFTGTAAFATTANAVAVSNITGLGTNVATFLATPSSTNLLNAVNDESGSGTLVFSNNATLYSSTIIPTSNTARGSIIKATAGQLADLEQFQDSAGTAIGGVSGIGQVFFGTTRPQVSTSTLIYVINGASGDGTTATITTSSSNTFQVGQWVTITGVTPSGYNGTYQVTAKPSSTQISFLNSTTTAYSSGGTISPGSATVSIVAQNTSSPPLIVKGSTSNNVPLTEWQNSSNVMVANITPTGIFSANSIGLNNYLAVYGVSGVSVGGRYSTYFAVIPSNSSPSAIIKNPGSGIQDPFTIINNSNVATFTINQAGKITHPDSAVVPLKVMASQTNPVAISSISATGTAVTYTTLVGAHNFSLGQIVTITGATNSAFNLTNVAITAITSSSFTVASTATGTTSTASAVASGTQTDLQQWQNASGSSLASVSSTGIFTGSGAGLSSLNTANLNSNTVTTLNATNFTATNVNATTVTATGIVSGSELTATLSSGDEGGQINLAKPATNTTLGGGVTIDVYQNKLRIFEQGGTARGAYIDLTAAAAGVATNLLSSGGSSDGNTTYDISSVTTTGGALLRLTASNPSGTDDVKFAGSGATTVSYTDASTITISSTDTTYTNGTGLTLTGNTFSVTANTYQPLDADLTAIAALANTAGYLYNNGTGTFSYNNAPLTSVSTLDSSKLNTNTVVTLNATNVAATNVTATSIKIGGADVQVISPFLLMGG